MGIYTELPDSVQEVDIIIAGGGTAGCIVASRLADADPNLSILIIEGGPNNYNVPTLMHPLFWPSQVFVESNSTLWYKGKKSSFTANRDILVPCGGVLGGGSSINLMQYSRAQRSDFDSWNTAGWSTNELLPLLKRIETFYGDDPNDVHGRDGPVHVSYGTYTATKAQDALLEAVKRMGWPQMEDVSCFGDTNGAMRAMRYVSPEGLRQDTATAYLHPKLQDGKHPNLHVLVESKVERVLIEQKKAVGVVYRPKPAPSENDDKKLSRTVKAKKMVVVSCGACGTPPVLERSGIGSSDVLARAGVEVVVDLPGVGVGYEDHQMMTCAYKSNLDPDQTLDPVIHGRLNPADLIKDKDERLGWNSIDVSCKLRPSETDIATLGPNFQRAWNALYKDVPDKPLIIMAQTNVFPGNPADVPQGQYLATAAFNLYPHSRGHMHITGKDLEDDLDFDAGFLSDAEGFDITVARWAYKTQREIMRRSKVYRGEQAIGHPPFPPDSSVACVNIDEPLPDDVQNLQYTTEDDNVIDQWLRENIGTTWHSLGTCKIGPLEKNGVVDANLNVHNVEGLKLADLSIAPRNVGANTANTAMVIGERAADIILQELAKKI